MGNIWSADEGIRRASALFEKKYGHAPEGVWAAPGRVNLIGEHTDYNSGLALPIALPLRAYAAVSRRRDTHAQLTTEMDDGASWSGDIEDIAPGRVADWVAYCAGPAWALRDAGITVPGFTAAIASCVPLGSGLSSSAAVECAVGLALSDLAGAGLGDSDDGRRQLAHLCVRAENEVAGAPTGGLDQSASLRARPGHALLLDLTESSVRHLPVDLPGYELLAIDTRASHSLADSQYGNRREECATAARHLGAASLREVADVVADKPDTALAELLAPLDPVLTRRARHVITEINRVRRFAAALEAADVGALGEIMNESHASLRDDFEVSCAELDVVVNAARAAGAVGARITGGGFGGSAIALVPSDLVRDVSSAVATEAQRAGHPRPEIYPIYPAASAERLS